MVSLSSLSTRNYTLFKNGKMDFIKVTAVGEEDFNTVLNLEYSKGSWEFIADG